MARLNLLNLNFGARTHEGAPARNISAELQLRRSVLACLLWEVSSGREVLELSAAMHGLDAQTTIDQMAPLVL